MVAFKVGPEGAHQVMNRGEEPARVLVVSEMNAPEVSVYPDSGKILAGTRPPGGAGNRRGRLRDVSPRGRHRLLGGRGAAGTD